MSWIVERTRKNEKQILMDDLKVDSLGVWKDPLEKTPEGGQILLPKQFNTRFHANWVKMDFEKSEPDWEYNSIEYLR